MRFLLIAQTPSQNTRALAKAAYDGLCAYANTTSIVQYKQPLDVVAEDLQDCDGLLLGCLENIGALSGLTKDLFDRCYNAWLGKHEALPVGFYIRAGLDGTATSRTLTAYASAQHWRLIAEPMILHGTYKDEMCDEVADLAGRLSAGVEAGIY